MNVVKKNAFTQRVLFHSVQIECFIESGRDQRYVRQTIRRIEALKGCHNENWTFDGKSPFSLTALFGLCLMMSSSASWTRSIDLVFVRDEPTVISSSESRSIVFMQEQPPCSSWGNSSQNCCFHMNGGRLNSASTASSLMAVAGNCVPTLSANVWKHFLVYAFPLASNLELIQRIYRTLKLHEVLVELLYICQSLIVNVTLCPIKHGEKRVRAHMAANVRVCSEVRLFRNETLQ